MLRSHSLGHRRIDTSQHLRACVYRFQAPMANQFQSDLNRFRDMFELSKSCSESNNR